MWVFMFLFWADFGCLYFFIFLENNLKLIFVLALQQI